MKQNTIQNKFPVIAALLFISIIFLSSCIKSRDGRTDFSSLQPVVLIPEGGLSAFSSQALLFPGSDASDTAMFYVNYAATDVAPVDEMITLTVDAAALASYNASNPTKYKMFPDSIYSFKSTQVVVKKGMNYTDAINLVVFPVKIDPSQNYMLPISIKAVPVGSTISGNFGTIYYHFIGNPIAGKYTQEWIRYNNVGGTGSPTNDVTSAAAFAPLDPTTITVASGSAGLKYVMSFDNNNGVLSNFMISFDGASVAASGVTITGGPTIIVADAVNHKYQFNFTYNNAAGSARNITDKFN